MKHLYVDGHVHIDPEYDLRLFCRRGMNVAADVGGPLLLLLAERDGDDSFCQLQADSSRSDCSPFVVQTTGEAVSLQISTVQGDSDAELFLIAGRQLVSKDRVEVLVIGLATDDPIFRPDSHTFTTLDLVRAALNAGAITILPWGFGKWLGRRGRLIQSIAETSELADSPLLFFGDILARCWPWPRPRCFDEGVRVLPGTDILPLCGGESQLASYGFRVRADFDPQAPCRSLMDALRDGQPIEPFGRRATLLRALSDQVRYRLKQYHGHPQLQRKYGLTQ